MFEQVHESMCPVYYCSIKTRPDMNDVYLYQGYCFVQLFSYRQHIHKAMHYMFKFRLTTDISVYVLLNCTSEVKKRCDVFKENTGTGQTGFVTEQVLKD